jgi:hypothetical protein
LARKGLVEVAREPSHRLEHREVSAVHARRPVGGQPRDVGPADRLAGRGLFGERVAAVGEGERQHRLV